jgi:hypothetical protein
MVVEDIVAVCTSVGSVDDGIVALYRHEIARLLVGCAGFVFGVRCFRDEVGEVVGLSQHWIILN